MDLTRFFSVGVRCAVVVFALLAGTLKAARAQNEPQSLVVSEEPSIVGCGKAEALKRRFLGETFQGTSGGVAEAMGETDVLHNDLTIELSNLNPAADNCTIVGQNRMTIQSMSANLTQFTFRLRSQYTITSALINDVTPVTVATTSTTTRVVTLDRAYAMDEVFTLTIAYSGTSVSIGMESFEVQTHGGVTVVSSLSEPYYAYSWWPVKDGDFGVPGDNSDKATLDLTVTVPNNFVVAANGLLQSTVTLSGNRKQYHWSSDYPLATYLVSLAATNYTTWTKNYVYPGGTMPVEFFIYPENDTPANRQGWERATDMMTVFRPLFGEYPFINEKYGLYNFPFGGGMEHQTMTGQNGFSESLTSHELAHQWWGDAVTCRTWSDIWLNEGFATYAEALWIEYKLGFDDFVSYRNAMISRKPGNVNGSVYIPAGQTNSVGRIFDSDLSYRKGAWVLHQLRHVVGDAVFFEILAEWRVQYEGGAATTDEFVAVVEAVSGQELTWFFDQWVYQIGAPSYRFSWDAALVNGVPYLHVQIEQTQSASYPNVFTMPVDVSATISGTPQTLTVWNNARNQRAILQIADLPSAAQFDPNQWILRTSLSNTTLLLGNLDGDSDVDAADRTLFESCFTGSGGSATVACNNGRFDADADVDCDDWAGFKTAWTGGVAPADIAACQVPVPAVSTWGMVALSILILAAGSVVLYRHRPVATEIE